ncbi:Dihydrolipoyllysine-residue acetyltransferase component of acetoin cleaving system [Podospora conica]|nr:Dihydrolipoyllysine-residue acetyltransferase component of acetoin cleaving system [Schizothecium conicum]
MPSTPPPTQDAAAPSPAPSPDPSPELFHISLNPSRPTTLVLLHGLLSCHLEWSLLIPHLSPYHLLVVDLPGHSGSAHITPYTIPSMSDAVARLIRAHAHSAKAHVVGLSMGGFVTMDLARRYPQLCQSAFATGAAPFEGLFAFMAGYPSVVYGFMWLMVQMPEGVYWWLASKSTGYRRYEELKVEMGRNLRWEVVREVYTSILGGLGWDEVRATTGVRVLNVAGGRQDDVQATRKIGECWREEGVTERMGSRAVVVRGAVHAWNLQMPELFAEGITAWVEGKELPAEFEALV